MRLFTIIGIFILSTSFLHLEGTHKTAALPSTSETVTELSDADFVKSIKHGVVVVDFYATWCRPCKQLSPIMEEIAGDMGKKIKMYKMDTDKNPTTSQAYEIRYLPTVIIFKNGVQKNKLVGFQSKETIVEAINKEL